MGASAHPEVPSKASVALSKASMAPRSPLILGKEPQSWKDHPGLGHQNVHCLSCSSCLHCSWDTGGVCGLPSLPRTVRERFCSDHISDMSLPPAHESLVVPSNYIQTQAVADVTLFQPRGPPAGQMGRLIGVETGRLPRNPEHPSGLTFKTSPTPSLQAISNAQMAPQSSQGHLIVQSASQARQ